MDGSGSGTTWEPSGFIEGTIPATGTTPERVVPIGVGILTDAGGPHLAMRIGPQLLRITSANLAKLKLHQDRAFAEYVSRTDEPLGGGQ